MLRWELMVHPFLLAVSYSSTHSGATARFCDRSTLPLRKVTLKGRKQSAQDSSRLYLNPSDLDAKGQWPKTLGKASVGRPRSWIPPAHPECARGLRRLSVSRLPWEGRCGWTGLWTGSLWSLGCCICEFLGQFSPFLERKERENKNPSPFTVLGLEIRPVLECLCPRLFVRFQCRLSSFWRSNIYSILCLKAAF